MTKVSPYVYKLTHKITGEFYFGYRSANKIVADLDLPIYQTSSELIKSIGFHNFDYEIISIFTDGDSAYDFEQNKIKDNFNNPLCLNRNFVISKDGVRFKTPKNLSDATKDKISKALIGKIVSEDTRKKQSKSASKPRRPLTEATKNKLSKINIGRKVSDEVKQRLSITGKSNVELYKVHKCPHCLKEGKSMVMFRFHFDKCKYRNK